MRWEDYRIALLDILADPDPDRALDTFAAENRPHHVHRLRLILDLLGDAIEVLLANPEAHATPPPADPIDASSAQL